MLDSIRRHLPELDLDGTGKVSGMVHVLAGALWVQAQPSRGVSAADTADPELTALCWDFADILKDALAILVTGILADNDEPAGH